MKISYISLNIAVRNFSIVTYSKQNSDLVASESMDNPVGKDLSVKFTEIYESSNDSYLNEDCPETHVRCPGAYCIPSYMVNNGVYDCPYLESNDETLEIGFQYEYTSSVTLTCPGHYKCFKTFTCIHNDYLCDGIAHCPYLDDEKYYYY